jgi:hypothetical protein
MVVLSIGVNGWIAEKMTMKIEKLFYFDGNW